MDEKLQRLQRLAAEGVAPRLELLHALQRARRPLGDAWTGSRVPVVVDGFIATSAALVAVRLAPALRSYFEFGHRSAEPGHALLLDALGAAPLLELEMRLGEGTGAALGMDVVDAAVALYREMATFESAGISA